MGDSSRMVEQDTRTQALDTESATWVNCGVPTFPWTGDTSMLLRALLLLAVTLAGFGFHSRTDASAFSGSADTRLLRLAAVGLKHDTMRQVLQWLRHQPSIRSAVHDGRTLGVVFTDGTRGVILPAWRG